MAYFLSEQKTHKKHLDKIFTHKAIFIFPKDVSPNIILLNYFCLYNLDFDKNRPFGFIIKSDKSYTL